MNVILRKTLFFLFLFSAFPLLGQTTLVEAETYINTDYLYEFSSTPNGASGNIDPQHGDLTLTPLGAFQWSLRYVPDDNYIGPDAFTIVYFEGTNLKKYAFAMSVIPAKVIAFSDYASTATNESVVIEVLENDTSNTGVLNLSAIPVVNNGWAEFIPGTSTITFHPANGFVGLTDFNYVVCDDLGYCDNGTVSVTVMAAEVEEETLAVFTKKNTAQVILVPDTYTLNAAWPQQGTFDFSATPPLYTPNVDYVGLDYIYFSHEGAQMTVNIEVLDLAHNVFLFDDAYFTTSSTDIEFNILNNDLYGVSGTACITIGEAQHGTIIPWPENGLAKGNLVYIPDPNFTGVDWVDYTGHIGTCGGAGETARVYLHVSNFEPHLAAYKMSTPKHTPLLIGYDLPITAYRFEVAVPASLGEVNYYAGYQEITIYDQTLSGYNLLIYTPNEDVDAGEDDFEITYCVLDVDGNCTLDKTVKIDLTILDIGEGDTPMCFADCVWAGDTNFDGVVNMQDLLPIGLDMGAVGESRAHNPVEWYGEFGQDWSSPFNESPVNLKHIDADGDAMVTALDTAAIHDFYGKNHALVPAVLPFYENEIILEGNIFASPGDLVQLQMILGTADNVAEDIYGFTFPFAYNIDFFVPESVQVNFSHSSWLAYNSPILYMSHNDLEGKLEAGYTRTSGLSMSGRGNIGFVEILMEDDLDGFRIGNQALQTQVGGGISTVMNSAGQTFGMKVRDFTLHIIAAQGEDFDKLNPDLLKIGPNPASSYLNLHLNGAQGFEHVLVRNAVGQTVYNSGNLEGDNRTQIAVNTWMSGMYFVSVYTADGVITKKVEVQGF